MRRKRTSPREQLRLIQACRQSGLTDFDWCQAHGIPPATLYGWIHRLKQKGEMEVPVGVPTIVRKEAEPPDIVKIESKRYRNTRIAPKSVQEETKKEDERSIGENRSSPFLEATCLSVPAYSLFEGAGTWISKSSGLQPRLSASAYKRDTEISVSLEAQFRTCRSEHRQRSAISSWLFPLVQIRLRTAAALRSRIFCARSCIGITSSPLSA